MPWGTYTSIVTVRRKTAVLMAPSAAGLTMTVGLQPVEPAAIQISVSGGSSGDGSVFVSGLVAGVTVTERLEFSGAGYKQTARMFSTVGITTSGFDTESPVPTIAAKLVGHDGSPQSQSIALVDNYPATIDENDQFWPNMIGGGRTEDALATITLPYAEHWEPRPSDLVTDERGRTYVLLSGPLGASLLHPVSWVCRARRFEGEP